MNILNATDVTKKFLDETLFDNVKLTLNSGDTIGLVGRNGEGKTTLLRLLCGSESPTTGIISWKKYKIGYLDQILIMLIMKSLYLFKISIRRIKHHL